MSGDAPEIDGRMVSVIADFMQTRFGVTRSLPVTARVLAFVVELHVQELDFPLRATAAAWIGCSTHGLDAALRVSLTREVVRMRMNSDTTGARRRALARRRYVPSPELLLAVRRPVGGQAEMVQ